MCNHQLVAVSCDVLDQSKALIGSAASSERARERERERERERDGQGQIDQDRLVRSIIMRIDRLFA